MDYFYEALMVFFVLFGAWRLNYMIKKYIILYRCCVYGKYAHIYFKISKFHHVPASAGTTCGADFDCSVFIVEQTFISVKYFKGSTTSSQGLTVWLTLCQVFVWTNPLPFDRSFAQTLCVISNTVLDTHCIQLYQL